MTSRRLHAFTYSIGMGATAIMVAQILSPGSPLLRSPASLFWLSLTVLVALLPVRRLTGTQNVNLGSLVLFTTLLLFGTGTAIVAAWALGVASALSSPSGKRESDIHRAMIDSGKYVAGIGLAGLVLWGLTANRGTLDGGLSRWVFPRLLGAYALHLGARGVIQTMVIGLRDRRRPRRIRLIVPDWPAVSTWTVPPAAYLLVLIYLSSSVLTVTLLVSMLLIYGLTAGEERMSRSSWIRLTDGLRQACDGHVMKHRGETQGVVEIAIAIGRKMKLPPRNLRLLGHAAALHNIGYIALDAELVLRPGKLSPEDIATIKKHPECSRRILSEVPGMGDVAEIVRCHHENPDGSGYPYGLEGDTIPIEAAVIKTAEAFIAMTSPRVYRGGTLPRDQALEEIAEATGCAFDPVVTYYLFEIMGRQDLASETASKFGLPEKKTIRERLSRQTLDVHRKQSGSKVPARSIMTGLGLLGASLATAFIFDRFDITRPLSGSSIWFNLDTPGTIFLLALLGLAVLKPARLAWGAHCSWASAAMLAMVLAGGPFYIPVGGVAFIGWHLILRPGSPGNLKPKGRPVESREPRKGDEAALRRMHHHVMARISRANRLNREIKATTYALVLMLAGGGAWITCWVGQQVWSDSLFGLILSPLLVGVMSTGVFYLVETSLQAALLSRNGRSVSRIWYRNYIAAFPEPLTFAIFGFGIYLISGLLGLWTAMLVFTLPILWRQSVLVSRLKTLGTTRNLVKSIAKAVDLKDGYAGVQASTVAVTAVAVARKMGKGEPFIEEIEDAAILHDVGKASWPNKVLTQRAALNAREERYRYVHPDISAEIATWAGYPRSTAEMIGSHHEHYDGSGYMRGLKGDQIPLGGRILRVADSFGAMIEAGDPRFGRTLPETVREIRFGSGKQFDPKVVSALLEVLEKAVFGDPAEPAGGEAVDVTEEVGAGV